jgi:hypothetical protein
MARIVGPDCARAPVAKPAMAADIKMSLVASSLSDIS